MVAVAATPACPGHSTINKIPQERTGALWGPRRKRHPKGFGPRVLHRSSFLGLRRTFVLGAHTQGLSGAQGIFER